MTSRDEPNAAKSDRGVCLARPTVPALGTRTRVPQRLPAPVTDLWDWQLRGACRGLDVNVFFHPDGERGPARAAREARAKQVCGTCPIMAHCRRHALSVREPFGVWGGLSEFERAALIGRASRPLRPAPPGSSARPADAAQTPGLARNNRASSGYLERAAADPLQVRERGARITGTVELRFIPGPRPAVAVTVGRGHLDSGTTSGLRMIPTPTALSLINGSREEPHQQLTVVEVAAMLRVSRATVYRFVHAGHLPGMRVGRSIRVAREAVEKFMRDAALSGDQT